MKKPALLVLLANLLAASIASGAWGAGRDDLYARFRALEASLHAGGPSPIPFSVETQAGSGEAQGDVFAVLDHDFVPVSRALGSASSWCDIVPLHLNVKSCTYGEAQGQTRLTLYSGRKYYERPEEAHVLPYEFRLEEDRDDYFRVVLQADEGPLDSSDYVLEVEAVPLDAGETFLHLAYSYRFGLGMRVAMAGYFATLGSDKVGFSVVGVDGAGSPVYVGGFEGLIERNSVRYQLAIQAYLDTLDAPEGQRFEQRIAHWFDLTERHRRQLFELEQQEYLRSKRRERSDQLRLQRALTAGALEH